MIFSIFYITYEKLVVFKYIEIMGRRSNEVTLHLVPFIEMSKIISNASLSECLFFLQLKSVLNFETLCLLIRLV